MPPPMTPREKVELKPCPFCGGETISTHSQDMTEGPAYFWHKCETCGAETEGDYGEAEAASMWNRRTALASGSGDHAELVERLTAYDHCSMYDGSDWEDVASEAAAGIEALLAENAALREKVRTEIKLSVDNYVRATARATEAERKLAKAVGLLRLWMNRPRPKYGATFLYRDTSAFLAEESRD